MNPRFIQTGAPPGRFAIARRLRVPFPGDLARSTETRLDAIEDWSPEIGGWVRGLADRVDPRGARDREVRAAASLLRQPSRSATAKEIEAQLARYLSTAWPRERGKPSPPAGASPLRRALWRIAYFTDGEGLRWRTIYDLLEIAEE